MGYGRVDERTGYGSRPPHDSRGDAGFRGYYATQPHDSGYGVPDQRAWEPAEEPVREYDRFSVEDQIDELEERLEQMRTERDEAVAHGEDLGYQVEVLRSKLHELRRNGAGPNFNNISGQVDQMLRSAQAQADQIRAQAQ